ncbi:hypothetical protein GCM10010343_75990 [Streptomyces avidinii]|nr:hypothetical protein GCM10010343_75990 [Streptomyces avidinii]
MWGRLFGGGGGDPQPGPGGPSGPAPGPEGVSMAQITEPLSRNMAAIDGDFSMEGIQKLGNPVPMLVENAGKGLLELWLEPFGQDYWLQPGESFIVTSYGHWSDRPFETAHEPERIQVWAASCFATVTFPDGTEVPGGHQRPRAEYYENG